MQVLKKGLIDPNIKKEKKLDIATQLVGKMIPKDLNIHGEGLQTIIHNIIKYDAKPEKLVQAREIRNIES